MWVRTMAMATNRELYDFAARLGAFEGYVYHKDVMDPKYLPQWSEHLASQYAALPEEVRQDIQQLVDATAGRGLKSVLPVLG